MSIKQAIEALESCDPGDYSTGHVIHPSYDEEKVNAALAALRSMPQGEPVHKRQEIVWSDKDGVNHSMSIGGARELLERFWDEWPGGWSEVEAEKRARATPHTEAVRMSEAEIDAITKAQWGEQIGAMYAAYRAYARAVEQATAARLGVKMGDV